MPGSAYVALGSSYAAGPGIRPRANYPRQVAEALSLRLTDVTRSGATIANILSRPQRMVARTVPPQIHAVTAETRLVTITAGGNDLAYIGTLVRRSLANAVAWRLPVLPGALAAAIRGSADRPPPAAEISKVARSLASVVGEVRARAPGARVMLVDYLTVLGPDASGCRLVPLSPGEVDQGIATATGLAKAFDQAAADSGADLVRASVASIDHGVCAAEPWVTGFQLGNPLKGGPVPYHPTVAGMSAVAELVVLRLLEKTSG